VRRHERGARCDPAFSKITVSSDNNSRNYKSTEVGLADGHFEGPCSFCVPAWREEVRLFLLIRINSTRAPAGTVALLAGCLAPRLTSTAGILLGELALAFGSPLVAGLLEEGSCTLVHRRSLLVPFGCALVCLSPPSPMFLGHLVGRHTAREHGMPSGKSTRYRA
jgi:hypothetical protein